MEVLETFGSMRDVMQEGLDKMLGADNKLGAPALSAKAVFEELKAAR